MATEIIFPLLTSYIQIGTSTMEHHLSAIRGLKKVKYRTTLKKQDYHRPKSIGVKQANKMLVTFAFTRHPFNRFVSAYNCFFLHKCAIINKRYIQHNFKHGKTRPYWYRAIRNKVLAKYRHIDPEKSQEVPTPRELIHYLVGLSIWDKKKIVQTCPCTKDNTL